MLKLQYFGHLMWRTDSLEKTLMLRKIEGNLDAETLMLRDPDAEKGASENEMVGWHQQLNGHEFEQTQGHSVGQGSLLCCSSQGRKESDTT